MEQTRDVLKIVGNADINDGYFGVCLAGQDINCRATIEDIENHLRGNF